MSSFTLEDEEDSSLKETFFSSFVLDLLMRKLASTLTAFRCIYSRVAGSLSLSWYAMYGSKASGYWRSAKPGGGFISSRMELYTILNLVVNSCTISFKFLFMELYSIKICNGFFFSCHHAKNNSINLLTMLDLPTCQGDIPGKKSQLDLRLFGVGVPAVGHKLMP